ncbi:MAG: ADP-ribosylglycohydrolase family protein [Myxococcales bacterium]|nr:ADP-ribosylglycohydrolase family protein [Myxococcales bacterium]
MRRARLSLQGLSVGDAFGERFFVNPSTVESLIEQRAIPRPPWRCTDDTIMAASIVDVLEACGTIDQDQLARAFARRYAADVDRGYGGIAHQVLRAIAFGHDWREVASGAFDGTGSMGNGGAMRAAPIGAFAQGEPALAAREARLSAQVTHAHPEGQAGAVAVAVAASVVDAAATPADVFSAVLAATPRGDTYAGLVAASELALDRDVAEAVRLLGNGTQVLSQDTVPFALWCVAKSFDSFTNAMWTTVSGLGDRDTTCAIVGGVIAVRRAAEPIPTDWLAAREPLDRLPGA